MLNIVNAVVQYVTNVNTSAVLAACAGNGRVLVAKEIGRNASVVTDRIVVAKWMSVLLTHVMKQSVKIVLKIGCSMVKIVVGIVRTVTTCTTISL